MKNILGRWFRPSAYRVGQGMRGRVHKISIIAGGEVSLVIRFGMDEPRARELLQGSLVEMFETRAGVPPAEGLVELGRVSDTGKAPAGSQVLSGCAVRAEIQKDDTQ